MVWYKRLKEGILTSTSEKKEAPEGLWIKCNQCKKATETDEHKQNLYVCSGCNYHFRIGSSEYFNLLFNDGKHTPLFTNIGPTDILKFKDIKAYKDRIKDAQIKTKLKDAIQCAHGKINKFNIVIACMDFNFVGGSMGSVVGEKISRSIDFCIAKKYPLLVISKSGGARMMESAFSLMQMAKTAAKLTLLSKNKIPYVSLLTDPTTGGVTASFAMLGDINIAEPGALIGFAGPRVIKETIKKDLPKGFQTSEFLLEHGFLDFIVERRDLKQKISDLLFLFKN